MNQMIAFVLLGLVLLIWGFGPMMAVLYVERKEWKGRGTIPKEKALYDERQRVLRLQASQYALFSLIGYLAVWAALHLGGWFKWTSAVVELSFCGGMLALTVRQIYCVLHDAAIGWNQTQRPAGSQMIVYLCGGCNFSVFAGTREGIVAAALLFASLCLFTMAGAELYARHRRKRADKLMEASCQEGEGL